MKRTAACLLALAVLGGLDVAAQESTAPATAAPDAAAGPRLSRLQGRASVDRRRDVTGATVRVRSMADPGRVWLTATDGRGEFKISGLPDGDYEMRIERHGFEAVVKENVNLRFPFRSIIEVKMTPAPRGTAAVTAAEGGTSGAVRVAGTVTGSGGTPLAEAQLRLVSATGSADPRLATTGPDGTFAFDDVPGGNWELVVRGVGMLPVRTRIDLAGTGAELAVVMTEQPAGYEPSPLELMPDEEAIAPPGFAGAVAAREGDASPLRTAK